MQAGSSIPKRVKGKKSVFFKDPAVDQVMTFFIELMTEVSVLRDRLDTVETLLQERGILTREDVDGYRHDDVDEQRRTAARQALLERVMRIDG